MPDKDLDRLLGEHDANKQARIGHEATWAAIASLIAPDGVTSPFGLGIDGQTTRGEIYDNTGEDAAETAKGAFTAMTTNPATRWMELGIFDEQYARDTVAGAYLYRETSKLFRCFRHPTALFNLAIDEDNDQLVNIGNSCMHVEEKPGRLPLFRACPMNKIWWQQNADGIIDRIDRELEVTATAAVDKWGGSLPEEILKMADTPGQKFDKVKFLHINCPRIERDPRKRDRRNMAFRSIYICLDVPQIVEDGGSHELEYIPSRWRVRPGELYGRGCGHKALGDIEILQRMNKTITVGGELAVWPTVMVPDEGVTGPITMKSKAIMTVRADYLANGAHPRPFNSGIEPRIGLELIMDRRELVRRSFMKQLIEIARDPKFTATQFLAIEGEQKRGLAPILARQQSERFANLVGRTYNILKRIPGVLEAPPEEIKGQPLQPNFDTEAAQAMRLGVAKSIATTFEGLAPIIKATGDDAIWDNFEIDESVRAFGEGTGLPPALLRPVDVRNRMREQRQQIAAERAQLENAKDATVSAKNLAPFIQAVTGATQAANANGGQPAPAGAAA